MNEIITETYAALQSDKMERISAIEKNLAGFDKGVPYTLHHN